MSDFTKKLLEWSPPSDWNKITTIDAHTAGEPLRIITSGLPEIKGSTILEMRKYFQKNHDDIRKILMWEPRGHADMYGCIITPPTTKDADFGVIFMHNEGYSTMCGHGIIAVTKVAIETGLVKKADPITNIKIDSVEEVSKAFVNGGGVLVSELHPKSFESKKVKGLYFVGETVDLHGPIGGFNVTIALSSGYAASSHLIAIL